MIRLQSNGNYWRAVWRDSFGKRRSKGLGSKGGVTRADAEAAVQALAAEHHIHPGRRDAARAPVLKHWCDTFLEQREARSSEGTMLIYRQTMAHLMRVFDADMRIDRITRETATGLLSYLSDEERRLSESTVAKYVRTTKTIFEEAKRQDIININPFDRIKSTPPQLDKTWHYVTSEQMLKILSGVKDIDGDWILLLALCRCAGLRLNEALRMQWSDVDWSTHTLQVTPANGRETTKQRRRTVPMQPVLYDLLLYEFTDHADDGVAKIVNLHEGNLHRRFARYIIDAGYQPWPKLFHTLRKNCETDWLGQGLPVMDVCDWMGHSAQISRQYYHQTRTQTIARVTQQEHKDVPAQRARRNDE